MKKKTYNLSLYLCKYIDKLATYDKTAHFSHVLTKDYKLGQHTGCAKSYMYTGVSTNLHLFVCVCVCLCVCVFACMSVAVSIGHWVCVFLCVKDRMCE